MNVDQENELYPLRNKPFISIAIPSSLISEAADLREKTRKVGYIGRAAAIFRVEEIMIYVDDNDENAETIAKILNYQEIPPYLKRRIFGKDSVLKYAGIIPPLKTPHHINPRVYGLDIREGIVEYSDDVKSIVDVGLDKKGIIYGSMQPIKTRITVKIVRETQGYYILKPIKRDEVEVYWGFIVKKFNSLQNLAEYSIHNNYTVIGASKKGLMLYRIESELGHALISTEKILLLFGGPKLDIDEIALNEGINIGRYCHYIVNFVPRQGVESIRTEEAIFIVLSLINYIKEKALMTMNSSF